MQVDEKTFLVNSLPSMAAFLAKVPKMLNEFKCITFTWRIGEDRSLDQNALFHVWLTIYAAHLARIDRRDVSPGMVEHMKQVAKTHYYNMTGYDWMIDRKVNPRTGEKGEVYYRSSADYKTGEMFLFLTWLQDTAAKQGLVLESTGKFQKLQREQMAA